MTRQPRHGQDGYPRMRQGPYGAPLQGYGRPQPDYGPQQPMQPAYPPGRFRDGLSGTAIGCILLGVVCVVMFIVMIYMASSGSTQDVLAKKVIDNNELRKRNQLLDKEVKALRQRLLRAGPNAYVPAAGSGAAEGTAAYWRDKFLDMQRQRDGLRRTAARYYARLSDSQIKALRASEHVFVPRQHIRLITDANGRKDIHFKVVSRATMVLRHVYGGIQFYQNNRQVHELDFRVERLDPNSSVDMKVAVPDTIQGQFDFAGYVKAGGV